MLLVKGTFLPTEEQQFSLTKNYSEITCNLDWIKMKSSPTEAIGPKSFSLIDLFSGCGGMSLGVKEALRLSNIKVDIKLAVDTNKAALQVFKKNLPIREKDLFNGDIKLLVSGNLGRPLTKKEKELSKKYSKIDILVAGPPCQGHSNLNNHTRRNDPRNNLYLNAVRFVEIVRPKVAIIENVSTVVHDKDKVVYKARKALEKQGYNIFSTVVNTADYGLAQERKRHIQVAVLGSKTNIDLKRYRLTKPFVLADYLEDIMEEHLHAKSIYNLPSATKALNLKRIKYLFKNNLFDLPDKERPACHKLKDHSYKSCYGRMYWDKPAQTITSGFGSMGQGRFVHPLQERVITPHEAARIQGFPDFFDFSFIKSRGDLHTMIANAVPPRVMAIIIRSLIEDNIL